MATRWGIVGAGKISHDFVVALSTLSHEEHKVVAVAERDIEKATAFANLHKIPVAYGSYEELAADENVDIAYIGTINKEHFPNGKLMLNSGKAVLCEKPLTLNAKQATELIGLARSKKLFLMEGVWSRCFPAYEKLKKEIAKGSLGEIVHVEVGLGLPIAEVERIQKKELGGGSILGLAVYVLQFASLIFGVKRPEDIVALGHLNEDGVDMSMSCVFVYEKGKTAVLSTSARVVFPNEAVVVGSKGIAKVPSPFWAPTKLEMPTRTCEFYLPAPPLPLMFPESMGLCYEAMEVRRCLKLCLQESPAITHEESLLLAELEDDLRSKLGVRFSVD